VRLRVQRKGGGLQAGSSVFKRWRRKRWLRQDRIPEWEWRRLLADVPIARGLDAHEQDLLHGLVVVFLHEKVFLGGGHFQVTPQRRRLIAVHACVPVLHLGLDYYDDWVEVLVYPGGFRVPREYRDEYGVVHRGESALAGEAWQRGPLIVSWEDVRSDLACPGRGRNVLIHEFAHKLDMLDGSANGLPPLHRDMPIAAWTAAFEAAYRGFCARVEQGEWTDIDPYAATHPAEFFAVITEAFFDAPWLLTREFPAVYEQLRRFFRQDPAGRIPPPPVPVG
jgi:MtfA peptidase